MQNWRFSRLEISRFSGVFFVFVCDSEICQALNNFIFSLWRAIESLDVFLILLNTAYLWFRSPSSMMSSLFDALIVLIVLVICVFSCFFCGCVCSNYCNTAESGYQSSFNLCLALFTIRTGFYSKIASSAFFPSHRPIQYNYSPCYSKCTNLKPFRLIFPHADHSNSVSPCISSLYERKSLTTLVKYGPEIGFAHSRLL